MSQFNAESLKYHLPFHSQDDTISTNTNIFIRGELFAQKQQRNKEENPDRVRSSFFGAGVYKHLGQSDC